MNLQRPTCYPATFGDVLDARLTPKDLVVACVYWGDKYSVDYVTRLSRAVAKHLTIPHTFTCVTVDPRVAEQVHTTKPLAPDTWDGWWQKVGLFAPGLFDNVPGRSALPIVARPVLYLDLDIVVTGSLDPFVRYVVPGNGLLMLENFGQNRPQAAHNSSIMLWVSNTCTEIYTDFGDHVRQQLHGDQCWIWRRKDGRIDNFHRGLGISYKYDARGGLPQRHPSAVVFHGKPDPHEVREAWVDEHWRSV